MVLDEIWKVDEMYVKRELISVSDWARVFTVSDVKVAIVELLSAQEVKVEGFNDSSGSSRIWTLLVSVQTIPETKTVVDDIVAR